MATIVLRSFGGMAPSANAKALPDAAATYAQNLDLRYGDFRPLPAAANLDNPMTPGQTLYRFDSVPWFHTNPNVANFVRGQIPNDTLERTYYTGDGAPKVVTKYNEVRQLGVPGPAAAPYVTVNATAQFSTDDSAYQQALRQREMVAAVRLNYTWPFVGLTDADLAGRFVPTNAEAKWSYSLTFAGSMVGGVFVPDNSIYAPLIDDRLAFNLWQASVSDPIVGRVDLDVRGQKIVLDLDGMALSLSQVLDPSDPAGTRSLLSTDQIMTIRADLVDALRPADAIYDDAIVRLRDLKDQFVALADSGSAAAAANAGAVAAFYAKTDTVDAIDDAVTQAVSAIYSAMFTYNNLP
jgi:hypothetical protein